MRNPRVVLDNLAAKSRRKGYRYRRLYRNLYNPKFYYEAYKNVYANESMTKNSEGEMIDGISLERIEKIIQKIKDQSYQPKPARRTISIKDGLHTPLGLQTTEDKLIQEIVRCILESIYEGKFSNDSHSFRPNRNCHTALYQLMRCFSGVKWFIVGEVNGFYEHIDHHVLVHILRKSIDDEKWIHLIWKFLKAGYLEDWIFYPSYSGIPKGGMISPILANIYLNELDQHIEEYKQRFNQGDHWRKQMHYIRYANHFMIGVVGSKEDCRMIQQDLTDFLKNNLKLELSQDKTRIIHSSKKVRFLGYDVCVPQRRSNPNRMVQRDETNVVLYLPKEVWVKKLVEYRAIQMNPKTKQWKAMHRPSLVHKDDLEILETYNSQIRGLYNYYKLAVNVSKSVSKFKYYMEYSMYKTFAYKYKSSVPQILRKYRVKGRFGVKVQTKEGQKERYLIDLPFKRRSLSE